MTLHWTAIDKTRARITVVIAALAFIGQGIPAMAAETVKLATVQGTFGSFPVYVARQLKLFEQRGVEVELVSGTGIEAANSLIGGATEFGAFPVGHGLAAISKGQDLKLLAVTLTRPPLSLIVRNEVPMPNAGKPYPQMLADLRGRRIGISAPGATSDIVLRFLLHDAGLEAQTDVTIVPVGDAAAALAGFKDATIDGVMAVEPMQVAAVAGRKIAKHVLNIEDGQGPELFREFAYSGVFARAATLKERPQAARAIVDALIEAEQHIQDPNRVGAIVEVAQGQMPDIDLELLRAYLNQHRKNFSPVATPKAIANVSQLLLAGKLIAQPVSWSQTVAQSLMPRELPNAADH